MTETHRPRRRRTPLVAAPIEATDLATVDDDVTTAHVQADDHLSNPPSDELPPVDLSAATDPSLRPGLAETDNDEEELDAGRLGRKALDFSIVRQSQYGLAPLLVLGGISFFQRFDTAAYGLAGPDIARDLNISVADIIGIQVLIGTLTVFVAIFAGYAADRSRRVPWVGIGTILSGVFSAVTSRGTSFAGIATPRVVDDVADEGSSVTRSSLLADYYDDRVRGKAFAFLGSLATAGSLAAPIAAGWVIANQGWRTALFVFSLPLVVIGVIAMFTLKEPIRGYWERRAMGVPEEEARIEDEPLSFGEGWRATWAVRTIRRTTIAGAFGEAASRIFGIFYPFFLAERYGLDAFERGLMFVPAVVFSIFGGLIGGTLVDYFTAKDPSNVLRVIGVFSLLLSPAPLLYTFIPPLWVLILFSCVTAFGGSMIGPASAVVSARVVPPAIRTQGIQITGLAALPTSIMFLPVARNLLRDYDYEGVFLYTIPFGVISALIFFSAAGFYELDVRNAYAQAAAKENFRKEKAAGSTKVLVARNVDVHYGDVQVLFDVDLDIEEGEILALLGTNGAGKSTVLRAMCGLTQASGGGIVFDGRDITRMPPHEIAARGIVQMPGGKGVFPGLTVRDNLLLGTWMIEDPLEKKERLGEVFEIFPELRDRADVNAGDLSGGQQQQLSLAQAFLAKPKMLLIDELSLGLSPAVVGQLIDIVKEINRRGVTIVVVEQSVNVALTIADRAIFMEKGEIRFDGPTADLLSRPDILRAVYVKGTGAMTGDRRASADLEAAPPILQVNSLVKRYGGITAVNDVSFDLRQGEVLGLIGPNGAGKTTIFELISGHQQADAGTVVFDGVDITDLTPDQRAQRKLIRRFQDARLFPSLSVHETMLVALEQQLRVKSALLGAVAAPNVRRAEKRLSQKADKLLDLLDLGVHRDKRIGELSTGLRRIVDLACVMAAEPEVLLLDEPSSGIAQAEAEGLAPLLRRIKFETGCSILIIEHDMPLISSVSDELIAFDQGTFVTRGAPEEVLNNPTVVESYLGTSEAAVNRSGSLT